MAYSLDLLFRIPTENDLPGPSIANIYIKTHTIDKNGHIFITPDCVSQKEIEEQIDRLKEELDTIRKEVHKKFKGI